MATLLSLSPKFGSSSAAGAVTDHAHSRSVPQAQPSGHGPDAGNRGGEAPFRGLRPFIDSSYPDTLAGGYYMLRNVGRE